MHADLLSHLENELKGNRSPEREARDSGDQPGRVPLFSKDLLQQVGSTVSDFWLFADISRGSHGDPEADDPGHFVQRSQILASDCKTIQRREVGGLPTSLHIKLRANAPNVFCHTALCRQHPAEKK